MQNPFKIILWIGILFLVGILTVNNDGKVSVSKERVDNVLDTAETVVKNTSSYIDRWGIERCCPDYNITCKHYWQTWEQTHRSLAEKGRGFYATSFSTGTIITPEIERALDNLTSNTSDVYGK